MNERPIGGSIADTQSAVNNEGVAMGDCYLCRTRMQRDRLHALPIYYHEGGDGRRVTVTVCNDAVACQTRRNQRTETEARTELAGRGASG